MASSGNINREIQLIIDVINYKMLKEKYLLGMLLAHPMRLDNQPVRLQILLCGDKYKIRWNQSQQVSIEMIKHHSDREQTLLAFFLYFFKRSN